MVHPQFAALAWHSLGYLFPPAQAIWANRKVQRGAADAVDAQGKFARDFVGQWEGRLKTFQALGNIVDQIYEHEMFRRDSVTSKAQASLNIAALVIAVMALFVTLPDSTDRLRYWPGWLVVLSLFYMLFAFLTAFRAVHLQRYSVVELSELQELLGATTPGAPVSGLEESIRARRMAAVRHNQAVTLCVANLVTASFACLRNAVLLLIVPPLAAISWEQVHALAFKLWAWIRGLACS